MSRVIKALVMAAFGAIHLVYGAEAPIDARERCLSCLTRDYGCVENCDCRCENPSHSGGGATCQPDGTVSISCSNGDPVNPQYSATICDSHACPPDPLPSCIPNGAGFCTGSSECCSNICGEWSGICGDMSPILIGLANNSANYHLTSAADGVLFDIDADGSADQVSWTEAATDVGFLVLDRNGNLVIDDASELFGNATRLGNNERARHGFEALADFDANADSRINGLDEVYPRLRLWVDSDHDGISQPSELKTLESAGITTILTDYTTSPRVDRNGNKYFYRGTALVMRNGHETPRAVFDVILAVAR